MLSALLRVDGGTMQDTAPALEYAADHVEDIGPAEDLVEHLPDAVPESIADIIYWVLDAMEFAGVNPVAVLGIIFLSQYIKQFIKKSGKRRAVAPALVTAMLSFGLAKNPAYYFEDVVPTVLEYLEVYIEVFWKHLATAIIAYGIFEDRLKKLMPKVFNPAVTAAEVAPVLADQPDGPPVDGLTERLTKATVDAALAAQKALEQKAKEEARKPAEGECYACFKPLRPGDLRVHKECEEEL